ncbi:MAG TPA: FixH family protein [Malonomonas sp.]
MPKNFYKTFIFCLLGAFLLFSGWSAYRASTHGTLVTDRDYYSKGLRYNSTMVEKRAASVLGWQLSTVLIDKQLQISLTDGKGVPVEGANGRLLFPQQANMTSNALLLAESKPGLYLVQLPDSLHGELAVRIDFEHQGARLNRQLLLSI